MVKLRSGFWVLGIGDRALIWLGLGIGDQFFVFGIGDRALIWLGLGMRSGVGFGELRSRFGLVRVKNVIGVLGLGKCDRGSIWFGLEM